MEKKQYIQPSMNMVKVEISTLMGASKGVPTYNPTESFDDEGKVGSRRRHRNLWDEEKENEEEYF